MHKIWSHHVHIVYSCITNATVMPVQKNFLLHESIHICHTQGSCSISFQNRFMNTSPIQSLTIQLLAFYAQDQLPVHIINPNQHQQCHLIIHDWTLNGLIFNTNAATHYKVVVSPNDSIFTDFTECFNSSRPSNIFIHHWTRPSMTAPLLVVCFKLKPNPVMLSDLIQFILSKVFINRCLNHSLSCFSNSLHCMSQYNPSSPATDRESWSAIWVPTLNSVYYPPADQCICLTLQGCCEGYCWKHASQPW